MPGIPFLKSVKVLTDEEREAVRPLFVVNLLASISTHNPADVSERAYAIFQIITFAADLREAIETAVFRLQEGEPSIEIEAVQQGFMSDYTSAQLVEKPPAHAGGLLRMPTKLTH